MTMRSFGLVAAFMLVAATGVAAQDRPDNENSPSKAERAPSSDNRGEEKGSMKRDESSKSEQRGGESRDRSAQEGKQQKKQSDRAANEGKSNESKTSNADASKGDQGRDKSAKDSKQSPDKAAESKSESSGDKSASESQTDKNKSAAERNAKDNKGGDSASGTGSGESGAGPSGKLTEDKKKVDEVKKVDVSGERRGRLQSAFKSHGDIKHETNVDVNISVGSRAPRSWTFVAVPVAVIDVVPEYRGYVFAYVGDNYVICDPDSYEVVALIPVGGSGGTYASGSAGSSAKCSTSISLNQDDRDFIIRSLEIGNEVNVSGVSVGWSVPGDVELRSFPSTIVERRGELGACRYFVVNDQIAIVDPDQDKVVFLLDEK